MVPNVVLSVTFCVTVAIEMIANKLFDKYIEKMEAKVGNSLYCTVPLGHCIYRYMNILTFLSCFVSLSISSSLLTAVELRS